jgi:hypothetical protein
MIWGVSRYAKYPEIYDQMERLHQGKQQHLVCLSDRVLEKGSCPIAPTPDWGDCYYKPLCVRSMLPIRALASRLTDDSFCHIMNERSFN